ncbi:tyrosine-type recombinase/integrase [Kitasatospora sp. NPDC048239]|uniref:tyrosine-type recombinase/integrase n=1 Tax=Kitasatospora sp. NPDC048239 TaxID=3364046 RepID=UPI00371F14D6
MSTLSSALSTAVYDGRLARNPAKPPTLPRPTSAPRRLWTEEQTARFLRFTHITDPLYADLAELMIGSGIRKGEALALHWDDVHLPDRVFFVRATPSAVDNNQLLLTTPKTKSSRMWVALSDRVASALDDRAGYVFHRHGRPLHPKNALDHFHLLCDKALRHRTLSTSANIYARRPDTPRRPRGRRRRRLDPRQCGPRRPRTHHLPRPAPLAPASTPHRHLPAYQQTRTEEPPAPWPMWPGDHRATTS